jgi:anti-anti-sigma factor
VLGQLELETLDHVPVGRLTGEIELSNVPQIEATLTRAVDNAAPGLVVDLSVTAYFDSAGIRMLFNLATLLSGRGQALHAVVPPGSRIEYLLSIVDVDRVVPCHPTTAAAVAAVRNGDGRAEAGSGS